MKVIDQNNAAAALERALVPGPALIDGRSETERLNFLGRFAALLNFYDGNNQRSGSWQPFLLKDPVFLLASVSHTDYQKEHRLFVQTCANLQDVINEQSIDGPLAIQNADEMIALFNQLFDQLTRVFLRIERWTHYMQMGTENYDLKKYTLDQVKETYNQYLWAVLSLRDYLAGSPVLTKQSADQILSVEQYVFDAFTDELWTKGGGSTPYMQLLGLYSIDQVKNENADVQATVGPIPYGVTITTQYYFNGLKNAGDLLFKFYRTIIHHATPEYEKIKDKKSGYPDTLLLRTFSDLLKVQQEQLNGVAAKHLDFYYTDILKQTEQPAIADSVFITIVLGKNITLFDLPAGSEFNAGNDAQKNPILFASTEDVVLNAAVIAAVYTLAPIVTVNESTNAVNPPQLYLQNVATPGVVATNEAGETLSWESFGGLTNADGTDAAVKNLAFAFGSPMLFLPEGLRQITVHFVFSTPPSATLFANAQIFLSTAAAWQQVKYSILPNDPAGTVSIQMLLDAGQPPIVPFTANPDGLNSTWPMFKLVFGSYAGLAIAPVLTSIEIDVCVTGVNTFALYNDNGLLSTKNPFQLFGPVVNLNGNFLIGSSEIFSKPLNWLSVEIDWDTLPPAPPVVPDPAPLDNGFGNYYYSYNSILFPDTKLPLTPLKPQLGFSPLVLSPVAQPESTTTGTTETPVETPKRTPVKDFFKKAWNVIKWPVTKLAGLFSRKKTEPEATAQAATNTNTAATATFIPPTPPAVAQPFPFANIYFTVGFSMLNYNTWDAFYMYNYGGNTDYTKWLNDPCGSGPVLPADSAINFQLFDTSVPVPATASSNGLNTKSVFGYFASKYDSPAETNPAIQQTPLTYDGTNASGFIKMTLTNPANGFGPSVYGNVVTDIVTRNALKISGSGFFNRVSPSDLISAANPPFAPKVQAISAMYSASQTYDLTAASESYPIQYFYYTPFASYTAYDNSPALSVNYSVDMSMIGEVGKINGLQLVPSFTANAATETALGCAGAMYIGLTGLIPGSPISLYFELATTYSAPAAGAEVNYYYLSTSGWKALSLQKDGTNQFTCSGIVTLNIPADIALQDVSMPLNMYWITIGASIGGNATLDLSSFAQVVLLAPNGVELTRSGAAYLTDTTAPVIANGAITKPENAIAQIGTVAQPFPSFGGRAAEDQEQMYTRVSRRLKTKDRGVSGNDMFTLITQQFPDIYFSGSVFAPDTNVTTIYVVEGFDSYTDANAYRPLVSACEMGKIGDFLNKRVSLFSNIAVSNYSFQQVSVTANVTVRQGYVPAAMTANISQALNIFLSPWIANSGQEQVNIGQPVTGSQIAAFIRDIAGVLTVSGVQLYSTAAPSTPVQTITPAAGALLVSSLKHTINTSLAT